MPTNPATSTEHRSTTRTTGRKLVASIAGVFAVLAVSAHGTPEYQPDDMHWPKPNTTVVADGTQDSQPPAAYDMHW